MKKTLTFGLAALLVLIYGSDTCRAKIVIPTNFGVGADAEVREFQPLNNFGASTELASRVKDEFPLGDPNDGSDRNSSMYLKFDLSGLTPADAVGTAVQLTVRNNVQIRRGEVYDLDNVDPDFKRNGLQYYGIPGATFDEATLTYLTAPGITFDGNVGTRDFNASAVFLGDVDFRLGASNSYYVGQKVKFYGGAALDAFIAGEIASNPNGVAVIAVLLRNDGVVPPEPNAWRNRNYLFNPKELVTLNTNPGYDSDILDPNNPTGGPFSGASNADGRFSPSLLLGVPEPSSFALLGAAVVSMLMNRRRLG